MDRVLLRVYVQARGKAVLLRPPPSREEPSAKWMERLAQLLQPFHEGGPSASERDVQAFRCCLLGSLEDVASHLWRHQVLWMDLQPLEEGREGDEQHVAVHFAELIEASASFSQGRYANEVTLEDEAMDGSDRLTISIELEAVNQDTDAPELALRPALPEAFVLQLQVAEGNSVVIARALEELGSRGPGLRVRCGNVEKGVREGIRHTLVLVRCWPEVPQALAELEACLQAPLEDGSDFMELPLDFSELAIAAEARGGADSIVAAVKSQDLPSLGEALHFHASVQALRWSAQGTVDPGRSKDSELVANNLVSSPRTWRISLEARSIRLSGRSANAFVAYSYGPLLQTRPFRTNPPALARKNATAYLPHAFAAYTLAGTLEELRARLEEPLRVEVWQRDVYKKDGLLGFVEAALAPVFERPLQHSPSMPSMVNGFRALDQALPIVSAEEPELERLGILRLLVFLEDLGPTTPEGPAAPATAAPHPWQAQGLGAAGQHPAAPGAEQFASPGGAEALAALAAIGSNAYEIELWRRGEEAKFRNQLAEQEAKAMERLDEEHERRELAREREFRKTQGEMREIEAKVRKKLQDLQRREVAVVAEETRVAALCGEVQRRTGLAVKDYEDAMRRQATEAQQALELARGKGRHLEGRLQELQRDLSATRLRVTELEAGLEEQRGRLESTPAARAQQELQALQLQIEEQMKQAEELKASREHFRSKVEELCRRLPAPQPPPAPPPPPAPRTEPGVVGLLPAGTAVPVALDGAAAARALPAQPLVSAGEDMFGVAQALRRIQEDLGHLAADWSAHPPLPERAEAGVRASTEELRPPPAPSLPPAAAHDSASQQHLAWLRGQRAELLQSGLYDEGDAVLRAIDARIAEARAQCGAHAL